MRLRHSVYGWLTGCLVLGACGCGEPLYPVEGTVTFNGVPVEGANVSFIPHDPQAESAVAVTDGVGKFRLHSGNRGPGARRGKYLVLIAKLDLPVRKPGEGEGQKMLNMSVIPRDLLPVVYSNRDQTPFKEVEVPEGGKADFLFDLKGNPSSPGTP